MISMLTLSFDGWMMGGGRSGVEHLIRQLLDFLRQYIPFFGH
jgi:hypothetical protein